MVQLWCAVFVNHLIHNHCIMHSTIMLNSIDLTWIKADNRCFLVKTWVQVRELFGVWDAVSHLILKFFVSSLQFFIYYENMVVFLIRGWGIAIGSSFFFSFLFQKLGREFPLVFNISTDANFMDHLCSHSTKCTKKVLYNGDCMLW